MKSVAFLLASLTSVSAFGAVPQDRRAFVEAAIAGSAALVLGVPSTAHASRYCAAGVGEGCEDMSEGNEFIKSLQEKSAENKEQNLKDATLAFQVKNYPDFFASLNPPKYLVMKADESGFLVMTAEELAPLKADGKIKLTKPKTAFKGQTTDYSRKPMMMLVE